jgi:hypothetical protein
LPPRKAALFNHDTLDFMLLGKLELRAGLFWGKTIAAVAHGQMGQRTDMTAGTASKPLAKFSRRSPPFFIKKYDQIRQTKIFSARLHTSWQPAGERISL